MRQVALAAIAIVSLSLMYAPPAAAWWDDSHPLYSPAFTPPYPPPPPGAYSYRRKARVGHKAGTYRSAHRTSKKRHVVRRKRKLPAFYASYYPSWGGYYAPRFRPAARQW
ncbi:MAG TPA: hypothetical protein VG900_15805 [Hyphomicrobiaceae bacterium]|jgi:hypothetical protein|nr:hypothetical protein [Hyphomicrobiaceae bacterium]